MSPPSFLRVRTAPRRRPRPPRRCRPSASATPPAAVEVTNEDWRSQLRPEARQHMFNKILETFKKHLPVSVPESELKEFATRSEEDIYTAAKNQYDYHRKFSVKILSKEETETQMTTAANPSSSDPVVGNLNPADSASMDLTAQIGHAGDADWQEETYQKVKSMKELYFPELNEIHERVCMKLQMHEALPSAKQSVWVDKLRNLKQIIDFIIAVLQTSKDNIPVTLRDKLPNFEKRILGLLNERRKRMDAHSQLPGDQHSHSMTQQQTQPPLQQLDSNQDSSAGMQSASVPHVTIPSNQPASNIDTVQGNQLAAA